PVIAQSLAFSVEQDRLTFIGQPSLQISAQPQPQVQLLSGSPLFRSLRDREALLQSAGPIDIPLAQPEAVARLPLIFDPVAGGFESGGAHNLLSGAVAESGQLHPHPPSAPARSFHLHALRLESNSVVLFRVGCFVTA